MYIELCILSYVYRAMYMSYVYIAMYIELCVYSYVYIAMYMSYVYELCI